MTLFTLEGNIGAGKTTFAKELCQYIETNFERTSLHITEPLTEWRNIGGVNLLEMYYRNQKKWGFAFQINALLDMSQQEKSTRKFLIENQCQVVVAERSSFSVKELFNCLLQETEILTDTENTILSKLSSSLETQSYDRRLVNVVIYIKTDPLVCFGRVTERSREEEVGKVDIEYLRKLNDVHESKITSENLPKHYHLWSVDGNTFNKNDLGGVEILTTTGEKFKLKDALAKLL